MATARANQLRKLAQSVPGANERVTQGLQAAQETQLQETIRQARPQAGPRAAQALGAQQAQQIGQAQLQQQQQTQQDIGRLAQVAGQEQRLQTQQRVGEAQRGFSRKARQQADKLAELDQELKNKLLDQQLDFKQDERGRALMNERQLADWAVMNAKNEEQFKNYQQQVEQMGRRKEQMLEAAYRKLTAALQGKGAFKEQRLDQESKQRILEARKQVQNKIRREQIEQANRQAMWSGLMTAVGAGAGAAFGGPGGASAGGQAGAGIGAGAATLTS